MANPDPKPPLREVVTIDGTNVTLQMKSNPIENLGVLTGQELFHYLNIFDDKFQPSNYNKADGTPLRLFDSKSVKIDVSKRSKEDMGFWHRNVDNHEVIICVRGALRWETEMGTVILREGEMILIPKGISHRSMLCEDSLEENVLIELKIAEKLNYVGDNK
ncbi:AraC family ligand binding domain-containing protein [Lacisediminimonas sp.]|jgi:oxalate decarboxylase/phosphoglucose isomerase-like protein (cupin superfamily)|uniref:AraC family ligand binding domain-containing protein n=1 Tax=Lacisediminimonas sp. TaxID=3060582 RepID=UPI002724D8A8|nr:AraC family ligand binding domain-containing protein [Lacisediminimonas sp.]MDO8298276.1 AraC family ligand binding domain-containing protein [Lacisediminimonas sp.]